MGKKFSRRIVHNKLSLDAFENLLVEYFLQAGIDIYSSDCEKVIPNFISDNAHSLFTTISNQSHGILCEQIELRTGFINRNKIRWQPLLNKLFTYIAITMEIGDLFCSTNHNNASRQSDHKLLALMWLHNRSCLIANEMFCLIENGFADGALARWRSLHELSATASFLNQNDNKIALKYLKHEIIIKYKRMVSYNEHSDILGNMPFSDEELDNAKEAADELIAEYGPTYNKDYGWASEALSKPSFKEIEKAAGLEHLRPYYEWSLKKIHAGHIWDYADLGTSECDAPVLLAGASNSGMEDPSHLLVTSLLNTSSSLFTCCPQLDCLIYFKLLTLLAEDIGHLLEIGWATNP